jgi:CVNH domain
MSYLSKLNGLSSSIILVAYGAMLVAIPNDAMAESTSRSSYQNSCQNIQVDETTLSARCRRVNGGFNTTSIQIRGIENRNGTLTYLSDATDSSNYQNSCRNIQVYKRFLSARCDYRSDRLRQRVNGSSSTTSISIRGIENQNGTLTYSR